MHFAAQELNLELNKDCVEFYIKSAKVYWRRYDENGELILCNSVDFDNDSTNLVKLTYKQFCTFKNGGKRGGNIGIEKEEFIKQYKESFKECKNTDCSFTKKRIEEKYSKLKEIGILTDKNRLSHGWRILSNKQLNLPDLDWEVILPTIYRISQTNEKHMRNERSVKSINLSSKIIHNVKPKSLKHCVKKWDVSTYEDLNYHAQSGDNLDHDHIPSKLCLKGSQKKLLMK